MKCRVGARVGENRLGGREGLAGEMRIMKGVTRGRVDLKKGGSEGLRCVDV